MTTASGFSQGADSCPIESFLQPSATSIMSPTSSTILLFDNLPSTLFLGLDLLSITCTPAFRGIKNLTPGWHFLYTAPDASLSIRYGQWFHVAAPRSSSTVSNSHSEYRGSGKYGKVVAGRGDVIIWKWSEDEECMKRLSDQDLVSNAYVSQYQKGLQDLKDPLGRGLLNYAEPDGNGNDDSTSSRGSTSLDKEWRELTSCITAPLLDRVLSRAVDIQFAKEEKKHDNSHDNDGAHDEADDEQINAQNSRQRSSTKFTQGANSSTIRWRISSISSASQDVDRIPGLTSSQTDLEGEGYLSFSSVDLKRTWRDGAVGSERTDAARDKSWYLGHLIQQVITAGKIGVDNGDHSDNKGKTRKAGAMQLLGELQICFLMVLTLSNWSCLQQWKRLIGVLLGCRTALSEIEGFFVAALQVLSIQLRHCDDVEGGLFDFKDDGAGWLQTTLLQFRAAVDDVFGLESSEERSGKGSLKDELRTLEEELRERYGWESAKNVLQRGSIQLEDGEEINVHLKGADKEYETGEFAPVVVDLS